MNLAADSGVVVGSVLRPSGFGVRTISTLKKHEGTPRNAGEHQRTRETGPMQPSPFFYDSLTLSAGTTPLESAGSDWPLRFFGVYIYIHGDTMKNRKIKKKT